MNKIKINLENVDEGLIFKQKDINDSIRVNKKIEEFNIYDVPDAIQLNEAHERHAVNAPGSAIIETTCGSGENVCQYKNDCEILNALDDFLFDGLNGGLVLAVEVRFCKKYRPKNEWSGINNRPQNEWVNKRREVE